MAEIVLSSIAKDIVRRLASAAVQEVGLLWGVKEELTGLEDTISTIEAVLLDAEEKQSHNHQIKNWLKRLEDVVYDADDLMDEFNTEALLQQGMLGSEMTKKVRTFFSTSNQLAFRHKLGHKIKAIKERLAVIRDDRQFHLEDRHEESRVVARRREDSHSYVPEEEVIGRDEDKMAIMKFLMDEKIEENVAVISIVGTGGLGKTTLAQLVYNDETVQKNFDLRMWVCVSNDFTVRLLVEKILKFATDKDLKNMEMDQLQKDLRKEINVKRYLLVLDDVWNENDGLWLSLKILLSNCAKGSRIVVTTRSTRVGEIMSTVEPYILEGLDKDKSWSLFEKVAFKHGHEASNSNIAEIGKQIVKKCGGIPLVIRTIGRMLYFKNSETEWLSFLEEFSRVPQNDILPTLKLSYDNLPSYLKNCFASCQLFPKDYEFDVEMLVSFWMALGFVKQPNSMKSFVDMGHEYLNELFRRSFFQELHEDEFLETKCKMHDLMHDLATLVGGTKCISLQATGKSNFDKSTRHVSFQFHLDSLRQIPSALSQANKIRTILLLGQSSSTVQGRQGQSICDAIVSSFKLVRMLDLHNLGIKVVPNSIGKLRHLRYLDLSQNEDIKALPDSITMLYSLQTLKLSKCRQLQQLPRDTKKLVNLVNLDTFDCSSLTHMPNGLDQLTNLQTLTDFVLKRDSTGSSLSRHSDSGEVGELRDLMQLNNLRGDMIIRNLGNGKDTKSMNLMGKHLLCGLQLRWDISDVDYEATLEGLQPHQNLKSLSSGNYEGVRFSSWFPSLTSLVYLHLENCRKCQYLPRLTQFHSLKLLLLHELLSLEYISEESPMSSTTILPSLERVDLVELPNLKGWWSEELVDENSSSINNHYVSHSFPRLSELVIRGCPKLTFLPLSPNIVYITLANNTWKPFQQAMQNIPALKEASSSSSSLIPFSNLSSLILYEVEDLKSLPEWLKNLTSLREFGVIGCRHLKCLSPGIQHLASSLQVLHIARCYQLDMSDAADEFMWLALKSTLRSLFLTGLPQLETLPLGLQHVTSLQQLEVRDCEYLVEIPEWISNFKSLHTLEFIECCNLRSLPQGLRQLPSLQKLKIKDCPILYERCQRETGDDWPKVAHVPELILRLTASTKTSTSFSGCNWGMLNKFRVSQFCNKGMS
nr:putative disease resistance protein RGA1 [Ziziphus jujuba var. spinosa]